MSEDLLDPVRRKLLTEVVFTVGLETIGAVTENIEADKLCLLVKRLVTTSIILNLFCVYMFNSLKLVN